jgi:hypothetical protein
MVPDMKVNGIYQEMQEMVKESKSGQMDLSMRVIGEMIKLMDAVDLFMQMAMSMRVSGKMIKLMVSENTIILMVLAMRAIGKKTSNMAMVRRLGLMELAMKESTKKEKKMAMENFHGLMDQHTKANLLITTFKVKVFTLGLTIVNIMVFGSIIKCMDVEFLLGQMAENMMESISMTKSKDKEFLYGLMVGDMMVPGSMENNMGSVLTPLPKEKQRKENGRTGKESDGWEQMQIKAAQTNKIETINQLETYINNNKM